MLFRSGLLRPHAVQGLVPASPGGNMEAVVPRRKMIELGGLLFKRHLRDQVADARLDRLGGIEVDASALSEKERRRANPECQCGESDG